MNGESNGIVIVGGSIAGARAADAVVQMGYCGRITIIERGCEFPPVDRPPLSKSVLRGETLVSSDRVRVRVSQGVREKVEFVGGVQATGLDVGARVINLSDDRQLGFDGLVIACGAMPRSLVELENLTNVYSLRTPADAVELRGALLKSKQIVVVGGGVLGCEIASSASSMGVKVSVVDVLDGPMLTALGPYGSDVVRRQQARSGIAYYGQRRVVRAEVAPNTAVAHAVVLDDGSTIPVDAIVVAIGVKPDTDWAMASELQVRNGFICDESLFVNGGRGVVVAAGDVANRWDPYTQRLVRFEHWTNAVRLGKAAGSNLVARLRGRELAQVNDVPYFWTDQLGMRVQCLGIPHDAEWSRERCDEMKNQYIFIAKSRGQLTGVVMFNLPEEVPHWRDRLNASP